MAKPERKKHLFIDCDGFNWRDDDAERQPHVVTSILEVTCGQCKGRILNVIRDQDWSLLEDDEVRVLEIAAGVAAKQE